MPIPRFYSIRGMVARHNAAYPQDVISPKSAQLWVKNGYLKPCAEVEHYPRFVPVFDDHAFKKLSSRARSPQTRKMREAQKHKIAV